MTDATALVFDVDEADFQDAVLERSKQTPVVVDFWAAWCGPCHTLSPVLERAVEARGGDVVLAKVDVDRNQRLAQMFNVRGIPQVFGFRDGQAVAQFTGVVPPPQVEAFLDGLVPSEADQAVARARALSGDEAERELRRALELEPGHREAAVGLANLLVDRDPDEALRLVEPHRPDAAAEAVVTRVELVAGGGGDVEGLRAAVRDGRVDGTALLELGRALAAHGEYDEAIERLLEAVQLGGETREPAREQLVRLFAVLGDDDERVRSARPRLARSLF